MRAVAWAARPPTALDQKTVDDEFVAHDILKLPLISEDEAPPVQDFDAVLDSVKAKPDSQVSRTAQGALRDQGFDTSSAIGVTLMSSFATTTEDCSSIALIVSSAFPNRLFT